VRPAAARPPGARPPGARSLEALRREIARIDRELIALIAERTRLAREIGAAKHAAGMRVLDPPQEAAVVRRAATLARELELPDQEVREIFWQLIALSRRTQRERR
jgi:chorismate mutase